MLINNLESGLIILKKYSFLLNYLYYLFIIIITKQHKFKNIIYSEIFFRHKAI